MATRTSRSRRSASDVSRSARAVSKRCPRPWRRPIRRGWAED